MKIITVHQFKTRVLWAVFPASLISGLILYYTGNISRISMLQITGIICCMINLPVILFSALFWGLRNQIDKGFRYMWKHYKLIRLIERQLLDAGLYHTIKIGSLKLAELPWVTVCFSEDYESGRVYIRNSIKFHDELSRKNISPALGGYVVEQVYLTDDENHYCFDFYDSSVERRLIFDSFKAFKTYSDSLNPYELFIDKYTKLTLTHQLLAGQTGSGKSYALYGYLLQMLLKPTKYHLYFADPKASGIAMLGERISPDTTAVTFDGIVELLEAFVAEMGRRQSEMKRHLANKIDGDYRDFRLPPYIFLFDEYADFSTFLQTKDKKQRDHINNLISQIVLKGRQAGFFLWVVMQQAGSNNIPTYVRDNLPWKVVLGNAEDQTYVTAFGAGTEIPLRKMETDEGVFTYPSVANKPKLCSFPTLDFDVLEALETLKTLKTDAWQ